MAATTVYGPWIGEQKSGKVTQRAYMTYEVTTDNSKSFKVTVTSGVQQWNSNWSGNIGVTCTLTGQTDKSGKYGASGGQFLWPAFSSVVIPFDKTDTAQTKTITATSKVTSGVDSDHGKSAVVNKVCTVTATFTVSKRYAVAYVNVSGTWKRGIVYVNVGGTWKEATDLYTNVSGTWKGFTE